MISATFTKTWPWSVTGHRAWQAVVRDVCGLINYWRGETWSHYNLDVRTEDGGRNLDSVQPDNPFITEPCGIRDHVFMDLLQYGRQLSPTSTSVIRPQSSVIQKTWSCHRIYSSLRTWIKVERKPIVEICRWISSLCVYTTLQASSQMDPQWQGESWIHSDKVSHKHKLWVFVSLNHHVKIRATFHPRFSSLHVTHWSTNYSKLRMSWTDIARIIA